jgi:ribosomal protein L31
VKRWLVLAGLAGLGATVALAQGGTDFSFMPDGGKGNFVAVFGTGDKARATLSEAHTAEEWTARIEAEKPDLTPSERDTLAGYLAINTPLEQLADVAGAKQDITLMMPPDGREIAVAQCQYCHSFFTGYLMQRRDEDGWVSTFKSPFHKEITISDAEKQTFANYSAINMPMRFDDVPPDLRY